MNTIAKLESSDGIFEVETIRIDFKRRTLKGEFNGIKFIDNDTKQAVIYVPALEISGYGENYDKAHELLMATVTEYFPYLKKLTTEEFENEFRKLGWKKGFFNKQYSKASVDIDGVLQNINAEGNKVELMSLTAA